MPKYGVQQGALYAAEARVGPTRTFTSVAEAQKWLDGLVEDLEIDDITIIPARMSAWQNASRVMHLARTQLNVRVICHELAHALTPGDGHHEAFARAYLDLVRRFIGFYQYAELLYEIREEGVFATV